MPLWFAVSINLSKSECSQLSAGQSETLFIYIQTYSYPAFQKRKLNFLMLESTCFIILETQVEW
jgi:hypothetical protein